MAEHLAYRIADNDLVELKRVENEDQAKVAIYEEIAMKVRSSIWNPIEGERSNYDTADHEQLNDWLHHVWEHLQKFDHFMVEPVEQRDGFQLTLGVYTINE